MAMPIIFQTVVKLFNQQRDINRMGFLASFFVTAPDSFTDGDTISLDIIRTGEEVAPVVKDLESGSVTLVEDKFTNKEVPFPVYSLDSPVGISQLMKRQPGESAFLEAKMDWFGRLAKILVSKFATMTSMIRRSTELQASQVLQTGTITLTDENGTPAYELDLKPKASHFPTVVNSWDGPDANPMEDIDALSDTIRNDGQCDIVNLIFGRRAWEYFIKNDWVRENFKKDTLGLGALDPSFRDKGSRYMGYINSGSDRYDLWLYSGRYNPFKSTEYKKFLDDYKIIFLPLSSDLDFRRYYGGIPSVFPDPIFDELFADKVQIDNEYDFRPRVYPDQKKEVWTGEIKSRPICLPVSIDRYGCLTVKAEE